MFNPTFKMFRENLLLGEEKSRKTLQPAGKDTQYHIQKYISPYVGQKNTHYIKDSPEHNLDSERPVTVHGHSFIKGQAHAIVSQDEGPKVAVKFSSVHKPGKISNVGLGYEDAFIQRLKQHGIMPQEAEGAGSSAGTDFLINNKRKKQVHQGKVTADEDLLRGETKANTDAAFGQLTISYSPDKGWHIPDKNREKRPNYATAIEHAGLIDWMNNNYGDALKAETTASGRAKTITKKHPNMNPATEYLKDHHVDVLHVGGHGTYSVGEDKTEHGLPGLQGLGKWTIRQKQRNNPLSRTIQFSPDGVNGLVKSHVNLDDDEHIMNFKKTIGVE